VRSTTWLDTSTAEENLRVWQRREIIEFTYEDLSANRLPDLILLLDSIETLTLFLRSLPSAQLRELLGRKVNTLDIGVKELDSITYNGRSGVSSFFLECPTVRKVHLTRAKGLTTVGLHGCKSLESLSIGPSVGSLYISQSGKDSLTQVVIRSEGRAHSLAELELVAYNGALLIEWRQLDVGALKTDLSTWKNLCAQANPMRFRLHASTLTIISGIAGCLPDIIHGVDSTTGPDCWYDRLSIEIDR